MAHSGQFGEILDRAFDMSVCESEKEYGEETGEEALVRLRAYFDKKFGKVTSDEKFKRARVYPLTRQTIVHTTRTTFISASRGFAREIAPSRKTTPSFHRRRYTVDADVKLSNYTLCKMNAAAGDPFERTLLEADGFFPGGVLNETDSLVARERQLALPNPNRYPEIINTENPPHDDRMFIELSGASLRNEDVRHIMTRSGLESWWADNTLNVALELLEQHYDDGAHDIALANSMVASILFSLGRDGFVENSDELTHFREYKQQFQEKKWIFLPVNDGFQGDDYDTLSSGVHWAFVLVDRNQRTAVYFDSLFACNAVYQWVAQAVATGFGSILGEQYHFMVDYRTPNQINANECEDEGACGPFVINLIDLFVRNIINMQREGQADDLVVCCNPWLMQFFYFDSSAVRENIYRIVWTAKKRELRKTAQREHDKMSLECLPEDVQVGEIPAWTRPDAAPAPSRKSSESSERSRKADTRMADKMTESKRVKTDDDPSVVSVPILKPDEMASSEQLSAEHMKLSSSESSPKHGGSGEGEWEKIDRPNSRLGSMSALFDDGKE